jgi:L-amino acid N-acyltransferase YncA
MKLIDVNQQNVTDAGFFCKMSQPKSAGYRRKLAWLEARFAEGLRIKLLDLSQGGRGFVEYIPGEYAWRPVEAAGYLFIHCLWVVGKSKKMGYARRLLEQCVADAQRLRLKGVAVVTSEGNWLVSKKIFLHHGFESVDRAPPSYELLVKKFGPTPPPSFVGGWDRRAESFGTGMTIVRSDQCPYLDDATEFATRTARERGLQTRVVELTSAREVRERSPSPFGVFAIVLDGSVISHYYLPEKKLAQILDERTV